MRWLSIFLSSGLAFSALGAEMAFITNQNSSDVSLVDLDAREEIARIFVPGKAAGVSVTKDRFYTISPDDATLREFSHQGEKCRELALDGGPIAVAVDEVHGHIFVTDWYNAMVYVVERETMELRTSLETGSAPSGVAVSPDAGIVAVADRDANQVSIFDAGTLEKRGAVVVGERPFGVTISDAGLIYASNVGSNSVSVVDPKAMAKIADIPTGERPYDVAFAQGKGFVTDQYQDQLTVFDETTHAVLAVIDTEEYPEGIDHNADQSEIYVANWFSNVVSVIDPKRLEVLDEIEVGDGPRAFGKFVREGSENDCDDPL